MCECVCVCVSVCVCVCVCVCLPGSRVPRSRRLYRYLLRIIHYIRDICIQNLYVNIYVYIAYIV